MIHPTAIIAPGATIGQNTQIGAYAVVEADAVVGDNCRIGTHAAILGSTRIGHNTQIHAGAVIGGEPQDYHYSGQTSHTQIGDNCIIREYVTINRGTAPGSTTTVGNQVMLMAFVHVGHNCQLGDNVIIANNSILGGYVEVGPRAFISSTVLIHQFCRIGCLAMLSGNDRITQDVPPYCMLALSEVHGPNLVGLKRAGFDMQTRTAIRSAIKSLYFSGLNRAQAADSIQAQYGHCPEVQYLVDFVRTSSRGLMPGRADTN